MSIGRELSKYGAVCLLLTVLVLAVPGCARSELECHDELGCVLVRPGEPVHIAFLLSLSGEAAFLGEDSKGGVELAVAERAGTLLEHPIELTAIDSGCSTVQSELAARSITTEVGFVGIIGPNCSDVVPVVMPAVEQAGLVMISPSAAAPELANSSQGAFFRTAHNNLLQARMAAEYAYTVLSARSAAVFYDESEYAKSLQEQFADAFRILGGVVVFQGPVGVGQAAVIERVATAAAGAPDVLYLPLFEAEAALVATSLSEFESLENTILIGADSLLVPTFSASGGEVVSGMFVSGTAVVGSDYEAFLNRWLGRYGDPPPGPYHAHAYDATGILLQAIESVAEVSSNGALLIGRQALRQAVATTTGYEGLTGTLTCSAGGECASGEAMAIFQITGETWPPPVVWMP